MSESCDLWKTKRTRAHIYKHKCMNTHIHTHTQTHKHTHIHACTQRRTHARERELACTQHTKCSFVIGVPSLWKHLPGNVKEAGSIEFLSRYLERSYLVNLSKYWFKNKIVAVCSTLFDLFVIKNGGKCPTSSHNTPVSTCAIYGTLWEVTKFTFDYFGKNTPSSHFTRSGIIARILNRQSSPNVLISTIEFNGRDIRCKRMKNNEIKIK